MTATPDEIFPIIIEKEKKLGLSNIDKIYYLNTPMEKFLNPKRVLYYNFKRNYNYICPKYFSSKKQILELIKNDNSNLKWLVFVSNKQDGEDLVNNIGKDSSFITAESKNSKFKDGKIYCEIVNEESFTCKILVCTSVIDNGINFKDNLLKNIVIFSYDKSEFIQMLGRKRVINNETVNLYLYSNSIQNIRNKLFNVNKQIAAICQLKKDSSSFLNQYFRNNELMSGILYFNKNSSPEINDLAEIKLYTSKKFYEKIIDNFQLIGNQAFILEQLAWLGLEETYNPTLWIDYVDSDTNKATLIKFLDINCNVNLSGQELQNFQDKFKELFVKAYGKQPNDKPDRPYKATKMRNLFLIYKLAYEITIKNKVFTLSKK